MLSVSCQLAKIRLCFGLYAHLIALLQLYDDVHDMYMLTVCAPESSSRYS